VHNKYALFCFVLLFCFVFFVLFCSVAFHHIYMYVCVFFATTSLANKDLYKYCFSIIDLWLDFHIANVPNYTRAFAATNTSQISDIMTSLIGQR